MVSDNDDLEHELQHNLKLRRKLGVRAAKAEAALSAKQGGGIAYRFGWVLYWLCLVLAGGWVLLLLGLDNFEIVRNFARDPWGSLAVVGLPALAIFGLGQAFRYVLSGE